MSQLKKHQPTAAEKFVLLGLPSLVKFYSSSVPNFFNNVIKKMYTHILSAIKLVMENHFYGIIPFID